MMTPEETADALKALWLRKAGISEKDTLLWDFRICKCSPAGHVYKDSPKGYELVCSYSGNPAPFPMVGYKWFWALAKEDLLEYARVVFLKGCYAEGAISSAKHDELCRKSIEELVALEAVGAF